MPSSSSSDAPRSPVPAAASAAARSNNNNNFPTSMSMSMDANDQQQPPMAKKPRNTTTTTTTEDEDDRIQRAAMILMKHPTYSVSEVSVGSRYNIYCPVHREKRWRGWFHNIVWSILFCWALHHHYCQRLFPRPPPAHTRGGGHYFGAPCAHSTSYHYCSFSPFFAHRLSSSYLTHYSL